MGSPKGSVRLVFRLSMIIVSCIFVQSIEKPKVDPFSFSPKNPQAGLLVRAVCLVSSGDHPLTLSWLFNGKRIEKGFENVEIRLYDDTSIMIKIRNIQFSNIGNYTCVATNAAGFDSHTVPLRFEGPPKWKNAPPAQADVLQGRLTMFHCDASGFPPPVTTWNRHISEGSVEVLRNDVRKNVLENGTLVINNVNEKDAGKYVCQVENGVGQKLAATLHLRVHEPPIMISEFQTISSKRGELIRLVCRAKGETPIIWEWSKGEKLLGMLHGDRYEITEENKPGFVASELVLRDSRTEDAGVYSCKAKNKFGETSGTLELTVLEPPEPPVDIKVTESGSRFVRLLWKPSYSGNTPVVHYIVRYWTTEGKGRRLQEIEVREETSTLVSKLHPGVRYYAVIAAENSVGSGTPSPPLEFTTNEEEPSAPPTDVIIQVTESTSLKISWKSPPKDTWNGRLTSYQVGFRKHGTELAYRFEMVRAKDFKSMELALTGLDPATRYDVIVRAINEAGMGPWSPEITATTSTGNPPKSPQLRVISSTSHSLQLEWDVHGSPKTDTVKQFVLEYGKSGKMSEKVHVPGSKRKLLLRGLEGNIRYELRMASYNEHGLSAFSPTVSETTMDFQSEAMTQENEATPFYLRLYFIVPVAVSVTVVVSTLVVAWACVARTRALESASHLLRETPYDYCAKMPLAPQQQVPPQMPINAGTLRPDHRPPTLEEAYDLPWDMTLSDGSYTRLQNGDGRRTMRVDHNRRSR